MSTHTLDRPQPLGIFALPAGYLVLPASEADGARRALMHGDTSVDLPDAWRFFALALRGDLNAAHDALAAQHDEIAAYNRFVLHSTPEAYTTLRDTLDGELRTLLDLVAFTLGYIDRAPEPGALNGEVLALALSAQASAEIEAGNAHKAIDILDRATVASNVASPLLAAQTLNQLAALRRSAQPQNASQALLHYREALRLAADTPLSMLRAELWLNQGTLLHEMADGQRGVLLEAVKCYQEAIRCGLSRDATPEQFALAHNNLALAYLSMPMTEASDQLRMAVAVQSLREALKVYTRDRYPEQWASTQLNLANALQYLPSSHPQDNLAQAVEIYEDVLQVRDRAFDPVGYARVLANQANALAHLGIFGPALEKLNEAHKLFHWHNEPDMAASVLALAGDINERIDARGASLAHSGG
jgi:tetratricopeptide (TPR) repeat protein